MEVSFSTFVRFHAFATECCVVQYSFLGKVGISKIKGPLTFRSSRDLLQSVPLGHSYQVGCANLHSNRDSESNRNSSCSTETLGKRVRRAPFQLLRCAHSKNPGSWCTYQELSFRLSLLLLRILRRVAFLSLSHGTCQSGLSSFFFSAFFSLLSFPATFSSRFFQHTTCRFSPKLSIVLKCFRSIVRVQSTKRFLTFSGNCQRKWSQRVLSEQPLRLENVPP